MKREKRTYNGGKLRIGDSWNAITIIALSQNNPLKAIAEFVENSIDAHARNVTIIRGREKGAPYLRIVDDGEGIPLDGEGVPNFKYVATHICDSIKQQLKREGALNLQGEFGIGLLSFWTVGEELRLVSGSIDGKRYEMVMTKGSPGYRISRQRSLLSSEGTELTVSPLLSGVRNLNGEKIQRYLASELRDRIRRSGVRIKVVDRTARKEILVEPREFSGRLLHQLPDTISPAGEIYHEIYLNELNTENRVGLYRSGTRVIPCITELERFNLEPWTSGWLEGILDVPFLNLTPGTRTGIIQDERFSDFAAAIRPLEEKLVEIVAEQRRAEEERASRKILKSVQNALKEAILSLPQEEYDWFDIHDRNRSGKHSVERGAEGDAVEGNAIPDGTREVPRQKEFFEFAGPLFSVRIFPASAVIAVGKNKGFRAIPRDKSRRLVEEGLTFDWRIEEGGGTLENPSDEIVTFTAPGEPGLVKLSLTVTQDKTAVTAKALVTVSDSILPKQLGGDAAAKGLPGYTFRRAPGELWRSRYEEKQNLIVINNGHRDFVYASKSRARKLRYICRLFAKELVYRNFPGMPADQLLERMIELSLYTEEHLK
ncbi:MAG: ATP-binding protein [bacterium]